MLFTLRVSLFNSFPLTLYRCIKGLHCILMPKEQRHFKSRQISDEQFQTVLFCSRPMSKGANRKFAFDQPRSLLGCWMAPLQLWAKLLHHCSKLYTRTIQREGFPLSISSNAKENSLASIVSFTLAK